MPPHPDRDAVDRQRDRLHPSAARRRADRRGHQASCVRQALGSGYRPRAEPCPRTGPRREPPRCPAAPEAPRVRTHIGYARTWPSASLPPRRDWPLPRPRSRSVAGGQPRRGVADRPTDHPSAGRCNLGRPSGHACIHPDLQPSTCPVANAPFVKVASKSKGRRLGRRGPWILLHARGPSRSPPRPNA